MYGHILPNSNSYTSRNWQSSAYVSLKACVLPLTEISYNVVTFFSKIKILTTVSSKLKKKIVSS